MCLNTAHLPQAPLFQTIVGKGRAEQCRMSPPPGEGWHRLGQQAPALRPWLVTDSAPEREVRHFGLACGRPRIEAAGDRLWRGVEWTSGSRANSGQMNTG